MKKVILTLFAALVIVMVAASCSHKTCPAYRGSVAENVTAE